MCKRLVRLASAKPMSANLCPKTYVRRSRMHACPHTTHCCAHAPRDSLGPAASAYKVTWQVYTGGLLMGEVYATLAGGSPVVISPVLTGTAYTISVFSRNLNHNPEDEWASSKRQVRIECGLEVLAPPACLVQLTTTN